MSETHWIYLCQEFGRSKRVAADLLSVLTAFPPVAPAAEPVDATSFKALEDMLPELRNRLHQELEAHLAKEVDGPQAAMFARRFEAVLSILDQHVKASPAARILKVGLVIRMAEMLVSRPTALRVRALVDFYFSQAGVLHHRLAAPDRAMPSLLELLEGSRWRKVDRGLFHRKVAGETKRGPVNLNALRFDRGRFRFSAVDCRSDVKAGRSFEKSVAGAGAVAGFSGGFFLYSEPDIAPPAQRFDPVGLVVSEGRVKQPPTYARPAFAQDRKGHCHLVHTSLKGLVIGFSTGARLQVAGVNNARRTGTVPVAFNRSHRPATPKHAGPLLTIVGDRLAAISKGGTVTIPVGGFVVTLPPHPEWLELSKRLRPGTRVEFHLPTGHAGGEMVDAIAGGPTLIDRGRTFDDATLVEEEFAAGAEPMTFSTDETGDQNLLPRLAIGLTAKHDVVVLAADGRNFDRALGLTLKQVASVMRALGCIHAVNMDGGASKRLVLKGKALDLPTTEIVAGRVRKDAVRPVHNGFFIYPMDKETP